MTIWNLFSLAGGLAVFLFGMMEMNKYLTSIAGSKMKSIMLTLTNGPARGYLTGLGITIVNQSSSATTVLEAALVSAGLMTFHQSLAVTLGAELGSTFLPQLVAFPSITKISTLVIFIGFMMLITAKRKRMRHIAMTVLTFGLLFLGMDMMSTALRPLREYEPFTRLMASVEHPLLGIIIGLLFTMIIQSSGATASITIAMALAGSITVEQAIPINLGAAVGTCITAVLGSLALNWDAKRSAYIHVMFQLIGSLWVFILLLIPFQGERFYIWWIKWFTLNVLGTESVARQIAMGFTFMPIINHIIVFPNLRFVVKIFERFFPPREAERPFGPIYISDAQIHTSVSLSLDMAKKEILHVASIIREMIEEMKASFRAKDTAIVERVTERDNQVDILHNAIVPFLAKLSQEELTQEQSDRCMDYIYIENELESIGDLIDKNVMNLAHKKIDQSLVFSEEGFHELEHLMYRINRNFELLMRAFESEDTSCSKEVLDFHKKKEEEKYKKLHIERLKKGLPETIATSSVHLDLITYLSRINTHIAYVAKRINSAFVGG
jgi:phosphate:Na+ symporter